MTTRLLVLLVLGSVGLLVCQTSYATPWTFDLTPADGVWKDLNFAASAEVSIEDNYLTLKLSNTSLTAGGQATQPVQALGGFWFTFSGYDSSDLVAVSAYAHEVYDFRTGTRTRTDSGVEKCNALLYDGDVLGDHTFNIQWTSDLNNVGSEWFYPGTNDDERGDYGIGAAGYGFFGDGTQFPSPFNTSSLRAVSYEDDKFSPFGPDGRDGTILPGTFALGEALSADGSVYAWDYVTFTWQDTRGLLTEDKIVGTWFQFGTDACEPNGPGGDGYHPIPEPASCALLALAAAGMGAALKRRRK